MSNFSKKIFNLKRIKFIYFVLFIFISFFVWGCSNDSITNPQKSEFIYGNYGLIDSLTGTCSTFLIRTIPLDTIDFRGYENLNINIDGKTDGDLSGIFLYYVVSDTAVNILTLEGVNQINNTKNIALTSPKVKTKFFVRLKLYSSICTGQLYYLKIRDLIINGSKNK